MEKIIVSACLLGVSCRYDGKSVPREKVIALMNKYILIPVCAEVLGGLATPRVPSEIVGGKVINKEGVDVTENYLRGAKEVLRLCKLYGVKKAILKEKSPSCGVNLIYDGTFSGTLKNGHGICADLLSRNGIEIFSEENSDKL
ncbi:MAG: DUF523 domain-containing protein [Ruminococcaceae bacterium]|nr:DUF523 domain-containing protein [Oscillospiraceae bacterium]